jgi:zinc-binding in reverse transcriptase
VPLAKHLFHIGKNDSLICPLCQQKEETVQHLMLHCPAHQAARQKLHNAMGGRSINLGKLFNSPKSLSALFTFITETECFHNTFGELPPLGKHRGRDREMQGEQAEPDE